MDGIDRPGSVAAMTASVAAGTLRATSRGNP
jgi:hypothetical protein